MFLLASFFLFLGFLFGGGGVCVESLISCMMQVCRIFFPPNFTLVYTKLYVLAFKFYL